MDWNLLDAMRFLGDCLLMLAVTASVMMVGGAVIAAKLTGTGDIGDFG